MRGLPDEDTQDGVSPTADVEKLVVEGRYGQADLALRRLEALIPSLAQTADGDTLLLALYGRALLLRQLNAGTQNAIAACDVLERAAHERESELWVATGCATRARFRIDSGDIGGATADLARADAEATTGDLSGDTGYRLLDGLALVYAGLRLHDRADEVRARIEQTIQHRRVLDQAQHWSTWSGELAARAMEPLAGGAKDPQQEMMGRAVEIAARLDELPDDAVPSTLRRGARGVRALSAAYRGRPSEALRLLGPDAFGTVGDLPVVERQIVSLAAMRAHALVGSLATARSLDDAATTAPATLPNLVLEVCRTRERLWLETYAGGDVIPVLHRMTELLVRLGWRGMDLVADTARQALEHQALRTESRTDALTGVGNRRALDEELRQLLRFGSLPLALILVDIDHFKEVNDVFTHVVGDEVLRRVAASLSLQLRTDDQLLRYGGDEFVVLLPGTGDEEADAVAQRMADAVAARPWSELADGLKVSITTGVAAVWSLSGRRPDADAERLFRRADERLLEGKRNRPEESRGRGRGRPAADPEPTEELVHLPDPGAPGDRSDVDDRNGIEDDERLDTAPAATAARSSLSDDANDLLAYVEGLDDVDTGLRFDSDLGDLSDLDDLDDTSLPPAPVIRLSPERSRPGPASPERRGLRSAFDPAPEDDDDFDPLTSPRSPDVVEARTQILDVIEGRHGLPSGPARSRRSTRDRAESPADDDSFRDRIEAFRPESLRDRPDPLGESPALRDAAVAAAHEVSARQAADEARMRAVREARAREDAARQAEILARAEREKAAQEAADRAEAERRAAAREARRAAQEALEAREAAERRAREKVAQEKAIREAAEAAAREAERAEKERLAAELRERERRERAEAERAEAEKRERERLEAEERRRVEAERRERERLEAEKREKERLEAEERRRIEAERRERERLEAEKREKERLEAEERRRIEAERRERERLEAEKREKERLEAERRARERERLEAEERERRRVEAEKRERERLEAEERERRRIETERLALERIKAERIARERIEAERVARERREAELREAELREAERREAERREAERREAERREAERRETERREAERREAERREAERREAERVAAEQREAERLERARQEAERRERVRQEAVRRERERIEAERRERERREREQQERRAREQREREAAALEARRQQEARARAEASARAQAQARAHAEEQARIKEEARARAVAAARARAEAEVERARASEQIRNEAYARAAEQARLATGSFSISHNAEPRETWTPPESQPLQRRAALYDSSLEPDEGSFAEGRRERRSQPRVSGASPLTAWSADDLDRADEAPERTPAEGRPAASGGPRLRREPFGPGTRNQAIIDLSARKRPRGPYSG
jgi:diguanylate cyclase (GGDEF)-like protein